MSTNAYVVEYAKSGRSTCQKCKEMIDKGELRQGSPLEISDRLSYKWRHWTCMTDLVLKNMRGKIERHGLQTAVHGLDGLKQKDRRRVERALQEGQLEAASEEEEEPSSSEGEEESEEEAPPPVKTPKKRAPLKKARAAAAAKKKAAEEEEEESSEEEEEEAEEEHKPQPKKRRAAKTARA